MENQTFTLTLSLDQVNTILGALGELPFRLSQALIVEISQQAQAQQAAQEEAATPKVVPKAK